MTFNEFRQLADNPPRKDEPSVFKVAVYGIDTIEMDQESENGDIESPRHREYYPEFPIYCYHEVLSATLHDAEAMMMRLFRDVPNAYCAVITELPFGDDIRSDYVSVRVYDNNGSLIDTSKCSILSPKSVTTTAISGAENPKKSALRKVTSWKCSVATA